MTQALVVSTALLWIAVLALLAVVVALVRQIGVLHERVFPVGALVATGGLRVGEAAPPATIDDLGGRPVRIGGEDEAGRSTLLYFLSPTCPICKALLPVVTRLAATERPAARVVFASDGDPAEHRSFVARERLGDTPYLLSGELGVLYQVAKLPYAVLIDGAGIVRAKGLVNTREHLESLFEAARLGVATMQEYLQGQEREAS